MPRRVVRPCECCGLKFYAADRSDMYSVTSDVSPGFRKPPPMHCQECRYHQGSSPEQQLKKYQDHEPKLRAAQEAAAAYAVRAEAQVKESRERVQSALQSRDHAIDVLARVQNIHTMKPDGGCTCGIKKDCRTAAELYGRWTQDMIRRRAPKHE